MRGINNDPQSIEARLAAMEKQFARLTSRAASAQPQASAVTIRQAAHGFSVGQVLRLSGSTWVLAKADTAANAQWVGVVGLVLNPDAFILVLPGSVLTGLTGLTAGARYYLDAATAGAITTTSPAVSVSVLFAITATTAVLLSYAPGLSATGMLMPTSSGLTAPAAGVAYILICGAGASGGVATRDAAPVYISTGTSWTSSAARNYLGGPGGGGGARVTLAVRVDSGDVFTTSVGAGGATAGAAGGNTTISLNGNLLATAGGGKGTAGFGQGGVHDIATAYLDYRYRPFIRLSAVDGAPGQAGRQVFVQDSSGATVTGGQGGGQNSVGGTNGHGGIGDSMVPNVGTTVQNYNWKGENGYAWVLFAPGS